MAKLLFLSLALCFQLTAASSRANEKIAAGVWQGSIGYASLQGFGYAFVIDVLQCIERTDTDLPHIADAINDFEEKTASSVLKALAKLAGALESLPFDLKVCKAAEFDVEEISNALKQMKSSTSFAYHADEDLIVNHEDIFHEIQSAVSYYRDQEWRSFGFQIGKALHKLIIGAQVKFVEFEQKFGRKYPQEEERQRRLAIFTHNLEHLRDLRRDEQGHLRRDEQGSATYNHLTPFADLSREEFAQRNGFKPDLMPQDSPLQLAAPLNISDLPKSFDWVEKGAVNPVKNQQSCGSCWAFATVANIEGAGFVENKKLLSLSEQELVDCDKKTGDLGCKGGLPSSAFKDMIENKIGLELESDYPYTARDGKCTASQSKEKVFIKDFVKISTDEDQIAAALIKYGPLAIGINAGPMQWYFGGVAHPFRFLCNPKQLDHGVAIVGFGVDNGKKYWKIRNSWGATWGEKGYYRIIRGKGACGLNTMVTTATGVTLDSADGQVIV